MKEWKIKQEIYHRLNRETPDMYGPDDIEMMEHTDSISIIETVFRYMGGWVPDKVVYPAKSYFVAIVYARLLRDYFGEDPLLALEDSQLLYGNDPYFKTYREAQYVYDAVLEAYGWDFDLTLGEIPDVRDYFLDEFIIPRTD